VPVRLGCRREDARGHASGSSLGATYIHERILPESPGGRTGTQNGKAPALLNRVLQMFLLAMGIWFL